MLRYAELDSLIYLLQELQDRVSLEVPAAFVKEESIREATDQNVAKYSIVYYDTANNEPDGDELDVEPIVDRLAKDVMETYAVDYDVDHVGRSRNSHETVVTVRWDDQRKAQFRKADVGPTAALPVTIYVGQDVYNLTTDGQTYAILKNGEPVVQAAPSPAYALGAMLGVLQAALPDVETSESMPPSPPTDFLAGLAMHIVETPGISDEAKEHFVQFFELVTLHDFEAQRDDA